jgi:hypothetical protein
MAELMAVPPPTQRPCSTAYVAAPTVSCAPRSRYICFIAGQTSGLNSRVRTHSPSSIMMTLKPASARPTAVVAPAAPVPMTT